MAKVFVAKARLTRNGEGNGLVVELCGEEGARRLDWTRYHARREVRGFEGRVGLDEWDEYRVNERVDNS